MQRFVASFTTNKSRIIKNLANGNQVFLNKCSGTKGGDDQESNPELPPYNPPGTCDGQQGLCLLVPEACEDWDGSESLLTDEDSTQLLSRQVELPRSLLVPRNDKSMTVQLGNNLRAVIIFLAYPLWRQYIDPQQVDTSQTETRFWQFLAIDCEDDDELFNIIDIDENWEGTTGSEPSPETEHVIDVSASCI